MAHASETIYTIYTYRNTNLQQMYGTIICMQYQQSVIL